MKLIAELQLSVRYRFEKEFHNDNELMEYLKRNCLLTEKHEFDDEELIAVIPDYGDEIGQDVDNFFAMLIEGDDECNNDVVLAEDTDAISEYINNISEPKPQDTETLDMFNKDGEVISRE